MAAKSSSPGRARRWCALSVWSALSAVSALAQVGHDPAKSPYRDLKYGQFVTTTSGYVLGDGGDFGLGPHRGFFTGLRHEFLADRTVTLALGGGYGWLERNIADTSIATGPRVTGPVDQQVTFGELVVQFNVTGGKTWHSLAPFVTAGAGLAFGRPVPADVSGYKFRTRLYIAPGAGTRVFLTRRLYLRLEARALFWNLTYPGSFRIDPDGLGPREPLLKRSALKEWAPTPVLTAGLGFAFHRPFF